VLVDNRDWTVGTSVLEFLRDVGKHATVNQMLARESVKKRLESEHGISFTEFAYMLLQANDYLWLYDHLGCTLQIGGSDQWGNIISGVDLIRRTRAAVVHALSWPLLTAADGTKLGKTTGARVWLSPERTSPYQFHQYWMQTDDRLVERSLLQFTLLPVEEIRSLVAVHEHAPHERRAQRVLADEVTTLVHGGDAARAAGDAAALLFGGDPTHASVEALDALRGEVPTTRVRGDDLDDPVRLLVTVGLATSNGDARRTLEQGGFRWNGERIAVDQDLRTASRLHGRYALLRRGKATYHLAEISSADVDVPETSR
jgi:tyrosyl-tRNA synthetase